MIDTSPGITKKYRAMIMSKTPTERLKMASRMFDSGKKLVKAGIIAKSGILSEEEMRAAIFTRMYQQNFWHAIADL
jgi:response regulator RpfG family c-di-GMP phosphodiesterase